MNKKAFTMVELLAVVAVLAIILLIAVPNVFRILNPSKQKLYDEQVNLIIKAAELVVINKPQYITWESDTKGYLLLRDINEAGYINMPIKDPLTDGSFPDDFKIIINVLPNGLYEYSYEGYTEPDPEEPGLPKETGPEYTDTSGANTPNLASNMISVVYNELTGHWLKANLNKSYAYNEQIWANAVTVKETGTYTREQYKAAPVGTVIEMNDILTFMVWIPRYEYKYTNLGTSYAGGTQEQPGEISINFISKNVTTPSTGEYKVHPAFTFGSEQLAGIWIGKFEIGYEGATTTAEAEQNVTTPNKVIIKPNVYSWRNINVSNLYTILKQMSQSGNMYGYSSSVDTHMIKNSEWGAVAYLSQSKYGKYGNSTYIGVNKEVAINNCSSYITGIAGDTVSAASSTITCTTAANKYDGTIGVTASTTGTIYGVYDMSGGAYEYVMGNYNQTVGSAGTSFNGITLASLDTKYYDLYTTTDATTACLGGICYGHALSETSGWYSDYSYFVDAANPWFIRGGSYNNTSGAGVFSSYNYNGDAYSSFASRLVHP